MWIDVFIGDTLVEVHVTGRDWRVYKAPGGRRLKGVERWLCRDPKRRDDFESEVFATLQAQANAD